MTQSSIHLGLCVMHGEDFANLWWDFLVILYYRLSWIINDVANTCTFFWAPPRMIFLSLLILANNHLYYQWSYMIYSISLLIIYSTALLILYDIFHSFSHPIWYSKSLFILWYIPYLCSSYMILHIWYKFHIFAHPTWYIPHLCSSYMIFHILACSRPRWYLSSKCFPCFKLLKTD